MLQAEIAGRHGSYATQFWRAIPGPRYRSRAAMRIAYSRKALNRRLVLPLDSHNWVRSLEVLNAGYARLGRTPEHYQAVLRDMVNHHGAYAELTDGMVSAPHAKNSLDSNACAAPSSSISLPSMTADVFSAIDSLRSSAYAGEIPANASLWVTLVWSYCKLQQPHEALETFYQAQRRFRFSSLTLQHMASLLLPVLCRNGQLEEATALYENYLNPNAEASVTDNGWKPSVRTSRSKLDDEEARCWLAEAAARQGDWGKTQQFAASPADLKRKPIEVDATADEEIPTDPYKPTIHSLFCDAESVATNAKSTLSATPTSQGDQRRLPQQGKSSKTAPRTSIRTLPVLSMLSSVAVRRLFYSLCRAATTADSAAAASTMTGKNESHYLTDALTCWEHLYGPLPTGTAKTDGNAGSDEPKANPSQRKTPPLQDIHELLNLYASCGDWEAALDFFSVVFLHRPSSLYLTAIPQDLVSLKDGIAAVDHEGGGDDSDFRNENYSTSLFPYEAEVPVDAVTLNLVFASLPKAADPLRLRTSATAKERDCRVLALPAAAYPVTVVRLLDDLFTYRDDMVLTDVVMAAAGPALLQLGQDERMFELLVRSPMMVRARERKAALQLSYERELMSVLVSLGYAAYALCRSEARRSEMVCRVPHLFPPEVVRCFAINTKVDVSSSTSPLAVLEGPVVSMPNGTTRSSFAPESVAEKQCRSTLYSTQETDASNTTAAGAGPTLSLLDRRWQRYTNTTPTKQITEDPPHIRDGSHAMKRRAAHRSGRSSATLTSLADAAMRRDYLRLQETRHVAFTGSYADADRDPRPIPKGLHDHASGWDFFGRGGEKVFANHKRTPHPFTMRPKVMRDLRNPYRSWNPRQNSSLAHKENVIKWNGKSAV